MGTLPVFVVLFNQRIRRPDVLEYFKIRVGGLFSKDIGVRLAKKKDLKQRAPYILGLADSDFFEWNSFKGDVEQAVAEEGDIEDWAKQTREEHRFIMIVPEKELPAGKPITLFAEVGMPSAEGTLPSSREWSYHYTVEEYPSAKLKLDNPKHFLPGQSIQFFLSTPLARIAEDCVEFDPPLPGAIVRRTPSGGVIIENTENTEFINYDRDVKVSLKPNGR